MLGILPGIIASSQAVAAGGNTISSLYSTGLQAYYDCRTNGSLPDNTGGTAGSVFGASWQASGSPVENAGYYYLDGINDYLESGITLIKNWSEFTVSMWIRQDTNALAKALMGNRATKDLLFVVQSTNTPETATPFNISCFSDKSGDKQFLFLNDEGDIIPEDTWCHFFMTYDGTTVNVYINAILVRTDSTSLAGDMADIGDTLMRFGHHGSQSNVNVYLEGGLSQIGTWNVGMTQSDATGIYNAGAGIPYD